ncbi:MAG: leucine-rich repeat protein [Bacilli bacterium]|nr:leucine-rich repeat protein [Bacilli bacterium]
MKKIGAIIAIIIFLALFGEHEVIGPIIVMGILIYIFIKLFKNIKQTSIKMQNFSTVTKVQNNSKINNIELKCAKCGNKLSLTHKFCGNCGEPFDGNNVKVELNPNAKLEASADVFITAKDFDPIFALPEDKLVEEFIEKELSKAEIDPNSKLIPSDILKRKRIFNIIFSVLIFIYISLMFFHFPIWTYIIGIIILFIFFKFTRNYNLMKYLKKQLKARPNEKISNIVMSTKTALVKDTSKITLFISLLIGLILPMIIFVKPIILYEKMDNGYGVRYYIFGLTNFTTATIPQTYKNENIISLRGNTFSNMPFLKEVTLPDTIIEIRGQAFKNDRSLTTVKLPSNLNYLGGGAFYNCTSLTSIEIPDLVTYIGGEAFYNAKSLKSVKLPINLTEIRGSTFENCSSLEAIVIPDSVTRIGGHAFYGNSSLSSVSISENSKLAEIGSSAFRRCDQLYEIYLPRTVYVNERAFKESPTTKRFYNEYTCNEYGCTTY